MRKVSAVKTQTFRFYKALVWLVRFLERIGVDVHRLRVVQFQYVAGKECEIVRVSMLNPNTVRQHGRPGSLDVAERNYLATVWEALVAPEPAPLMNFLADTRYRPLSLLNRSLHALIGRYPARKTGLNALDLMLLENVRDDGPSAARIIGSTLIGTLESLDDVSDSYLYHRLRRMGDAALNRKLVELNGPSPAMRDTEVRITQTGLDVLNGKTNAVEINGIDDWVCGVHLCSERYNVWYRDGDELVTS